MANIIFFGTPEYVVPILEKLSMRYKIVAVVTQPPKLVGREKFKEYSPVDTWAYKKKIPIYFESIKIVEDGVEADLGVLAAYGEFIPNKVINHFKYGVLNVHPSLLPKWRGASPVQASIISGDSQTGATIIKLDSEMDHGPIVSSFKDEVKSDDTTESLRNRLFERSADFLTDLIPHYFSGKVKANEQNHSQATFSKLIKKEDGFIPSEYLSSALAGKTLKKKWNIRFLNNYELVANPQNIERFIRAMHPWPIAWTNVEFEGITKSLKILKSHLLDNKLIIDEVKLEGKKEVSWKQFKEGYPKVDL